MDCMGRLVGLFCNVCKRNPVEEQNLCGSAVRGHELHGRRNAGEDMCGCIMSRYDSGFFYYRSWVSYFIFPLIFIKVTITIVLVNGVWRQWSEWDSCNVTCGGGEKSRRRECNGPFFDGDPCEGPTEERLTCNTFNCPSKETFCSKSPHITITALHKRFVEIVTE